MTFTEGNSGLEDGQKLAQAQRDVVGSPTSDLFKPSLNMAFSSLIQL